jgi:cell division protease FtsH
MNRLPGKTDGLENLDRQQSRPPNSDGRPDGPNRPANGTNGGGGGNSLYRWMMVIVAVMLAVYIYTYFSSNTTNQAQQGKEIAFSELYQQAELRNVDTATFTGQSEITGKLKTDYKGHKDFIVVQLPQQKDNERLHQLLIDNGATVIDQKPQDNSLWLTILINFLPWVILIALLIFFTRRATQGQQGIFSFGKSRAKLILEDRPSTTFADVAGVDESKYELQEVVEFLKTPQKFQRLGGKIPRGVLLVGPPGTGKTLLARAVAGEAGVPFFSMSGSEFVEVLVGVGASRVRDLFDQAKKASPSIIFIDEIDAVGRQRGASINTNDEREQTLNQLLVEMDGFDARQAVVVVAATNRPDGLDQALLRPGRFDRRVTVDRPDWNGRLAILKIHAKNVPLANDVDLLAVARQTTGMVGADLANLVNEAALLAARRNLDAVNQRCFDEALDKIVLGAERPLVLSEEDLDVTAYHESGHALTNLLMPDGDPVTKVTIVPRGQALGVTMYTPLDDRYNYEKEYLITRIVAALGGRAAEQVVFKRVTTGAENDLQRVTQIARQMVMRWGMSERLGTISYSERQSPFLQQSESVAPADYSEDTAELIDDEVDRIVRSCYDQALDLLNAHRPTLDRMAQALRRHETIDAGQISTILHETGVPVPDAQLQASPKKGVTIAPDPPPGERLPPPDVEYEG